MGKIHYALRLLRGYYYRLFIKSIGMRTNINPHLIIKHGENILIGMDVFIGRNVEIDASAGEIIIGDNVAIASQVSLMNSSHAYSDLSKSMIEQEPKKGSIVIKEDAWIGTKAILLTGVTIGKGAIVGAGAIVTKSVPDYAIACGNPARVIKYRNK